MAEPGSAPSGKKSSLFREAALERLNSPEQLDQRIRLIPPAMRLLAIGAALIIGAALVWAVFGSIPTRASGRGVLLSDGKGSFAVEPVTSGPVTELLVKHGDRVEAGTVIARIRQAALSTQLKGAQTRLAAVEDNLTRLEAANATIIAKSEDIARRQAAAIDQEIAAAKARVERLSSLLSGFEDLNKKGLLTASNLVNVQQEYDRTVLAIAHANAQKIEVEAALEQKREALAERQRQAQVGVDIVKAEVERLQTDLAVGSSVAAPVAGMIDEIRVGVGDVVSPGTVIATIGEVSATPQFQVIALFEDDMAQRVKSGMDVHVHPVTVRRAEHGTMVGRVEEITERSVSEHEVNAILRNSTLTRNLMGNGAPVLARITLVESKETPSGFAWWIGKGPPYRITRGTLIDVEVIVSRRPPIALVVPAVRRMLGVEG
ncbi:NHLP bacteriocin system secretion protein [Reyranella sp.]|uniref:NHLP bacteriocin system secretion protein n=1 Tax=Reyranella sp. TaxID=1929291 RepID=UPI003BAC287F